MIQIGQIWVHAHYCGDPSCEVIITNYNHKTVWFKSTNSEAATKYPALFGERESVLESFLNTYTLKK